MPAIHNKTKGDQLTYEALARMAPGTIFANGETVDSPNGCNMFDTGKVMRWVACRGQVPDWEIYVQSPHQLGEWDWETIRKFGDKVMGNSNIKFLVPADERAMKWYRK